VIASAVNETAGLFGASFEAVARVAASRHPRVRSLGSSRSRSPTAASSQREFGEAGAGWFSGGVSRGA